MIENIHHLLRDHTFQIVALGTGLLGLVSGVVGTYITLRKESLLGDALSHAALPGIGLAFMIMGYKNSLGLLLGASIVGVLATSLIKFIQHKSVVKFDSALSLILTSFFGLGLVLLTYIQRHGNASQAGLSNFIFGQASAMLRSDVRLITIISLLIFAIILLFWQPFKLQTFDPVFARTIYTHPKRIEFMLSAITVLTIMIGLESVGVVLISALLIGPSIAARQWSNQLHIVMILAGLFGTVSAVLGTFVSSMNRNIPTGPTIVIWISLIVLISLLFAPNRGIFARKRRLKKKRQQLLQQAREEQA